MTTGREDPRLTGEHVRSVASTAGTVTLVGVVHDHPASVYRVRRVLEAREPDVLALELPPISLSLFEAYARDVRTPPVFGGEMSAAIQAADTDEVVGIDGPTMAFTLALARTLVRERASQSTVRSVIRESTEERAMWRSRGIHEYYHVCRTGASVIVPTQLPEIPRTRRLHVVSLQNGAQYVTNYYNAYIIQPL